MAICGKVSSANPRVSSNDGYLVRFSTDDEILAIWMPERCACKNIASFLGNDRFSTLLSENYCKTREDHLASPLAISPSIVLTQKGCSVLEVVSQTLSIPSQPEVTRSEPSGFQPTARTALVWPLSRWILEVSRVSMILTSSSSDATAILRPLLPKRACLACMPGAARVMKACSWCLPVSSASKVAVLPSSEHATTASNCLFLLQVEAMQCPQFDYGKREPTEQSKEVMPSSKCSICSGSCPGFSVSQARNNASVPPE